MGIFGLFGKKETGLKVIDQVWMSEEAKFKACLALKQANPAMKFIAWFEDTKQKANAYFKEHQLEEEVYLADQLHGSLGEKVLMFLEHHPLKAEELKKAAELGLTEMTIMSSLTEPIFQAFGSIRILEIMQKMGVAEDEMISHSMVSDSIKRAQQKIAEKLIIPGSARSQADWLLNAGMNQNL